MHRNVEWLLKQFELCDKVKVVNERPEVAERMSCLCELEDQIDIVRERAEFSLLLIVFGVFVVSMLALIFLPPKTVFPLMVYGWGFALPCYMAIRLYGLPIKKRSEQELRTLMEDPLSKEVLELLKLLDEYRYKHILRVIHFL